MSTPEERILIIQRVSYVPGILGIIGCLFVVISHIRFREVRRAFAQRLILVCAIGQLEIIMQAWWGTFGLAGTDLVGQTPSPSCLGNAWFAEFQIAPLLIQTAYAGLFLYTVLLERKLPPRMISGQPSLVEILLYVGAALVGVLFASLPFAFDAYGYTGIGCWITSEFVGLRFGLLYAWVIAMVVFFTGILVAVLTKLLYYSSKVGTVKKRLPNILFLSGFILAMWLSNIFRTVNRIANLRDNNSFALDVLHVFFQLLGGAMFGFLCSLPFALFLPRYLTVSHPQTP